MHFSYMAVARVSEALVNSPMVYTSEWKPISDSHGHRVRPSLSSPTIHYSHPIRLQLPALLQDSYLFHKRFRFPFFFVCLLLLFHPFTSSARFDRRNSGSSADRSRLRVIETRNSPMAASSLQFTSMSACARSATGVTQSCAGVA